jgi:pilus assembly protein CpaF
VTSITEVGRMESDVITLSEIFKFKLEGLQADRTVAGALRATGLRPSFVDKFERHGVDLPPSLFGNGRSSVVSFSRNAEA